MANKNFSLPFPTEEYDAIMANVAKSQGYRPVIRNAEGESVDNPLTPEEFLKERFSTQFLSQHITVLVREAGEDARATASEEKEAELKAKFGLE